MEGKLRERIEIHSMIAHTCNYPSFIVSKGLVRSDEYSVVLGVSSSVDWRQLVGPQEDIEDVIY